ncbi:MAG: hypothetical protein JJ992_08025, partial [Planctomycetes bacterium]|nr:hypothetical protein [Planctomycetota bacterium]
EEADITVLVGGQPTLVRSVRLPGDDSAMALVGEIRRTIFTAQNQASEEVARGVTLVGDPVQLAPLRDRLAEQLGLDIDIFDPFEAVEVAAESLPNVPPNRGRYAALLGMLSDEAEGRQHGIDFLNPRRRREPPNRRLRYAVVGGIAVTCALVLLALALTYVRRFDRNIQNLQAQSKELDEQVKIAQQVQTDVAEIDKFTLGDVNWLDEVYRLSGDFPPPEDAIIEQASFNAVPSGGGQILLEGYVSEPKVIRDMEVSLSDQQHQVTGTGAQLDDRRQEHPWEFKEKIVVQPPDLDELAGVVTDESGTDESSAGETPGVEQTKDASPDAGGLEAEDGGQDDGAVDEADDNVVNQTTGEGANDDAA